MNCIRYISLLSIMVLLASCDLLYEEPEMTPQEVGRKSLRDYVSSRSLYQRSNVPYLDAVVYYSPIPRFDTGVTDTLFLVMGWNVVDTRGHQGIMRIDITVDDTFTTSPSPEGGAFSVAPYLVDPREWRITFDADIDTVDFVFYDSTVTKGSADYFGYGFTDSTLTLSLSDPKPFTFRGQPADSIVVMTAWEVDTGWVQTRWVLPDTGGVAMPDSVLQHYKVGQDYALYARRVYLTVTKSRHGRTIGHLQPMENRLVFTITD